MSNPELGRYTQYPDRADESTERGEMASSPRKSLAAKGQPRRPESRNVGSFLLFCTFFSAALLGACSSGDSAASGTGGASGLGGQGAPVAATGGAGGAGSAGTSGGEGSCFAFDSCIPSCSSPIVTRGSGTCDANGAVVCDNGYVPQSSCAPNACAQVYLQCCDDATGETATPACGPDGLLVACPAGARLEHASCIPSGLGISSCDGLQNTACTMAAQRCSQGNFFCICGPNPGADAGGMTWNCDLALP